MAQAVTRILYRLALLLALHAFPSAAFAHRDDQYLQATLVAIEPSGVRLQINLTPGVAVAEQLLAEIDRDRDGAISNNEAAAYAQMLKRDLTLRMDGRKLELKLPASEFVEPAELRSGSGIIKMEFSASSGPLATGLHRLTLDNRHLTAMSVYLINAVQPKFATVQITRQKRNVNQSAGEIEFTFQPVVPKDRRIRWTDVNPVGEKEAGSFMARRANTLTSKKGARPFASPFSSPYGISASRVLDCHVEAYWHICCARYGISGWGCHSTLGVSAARSPCFITLPLQLKSPAGGISCLELQ